MIVPKEEGGASSSAAGAICQAAHLVSLLMKGLTFEQARIQVEAQVVKTADHIGSELLPLVSSKRRQNVTVEILHGMLVKACRLSLEWLEGEAPYAADIYTSPEGYHRHQCSICGNVWEHENSSNRSHIPMKIEENMHKCPRCSNKAQETFVGWRVYDGVLAPSETTRK